MKWDQKYGSLVSAMEKSICYLWTDKKTTEPYLLCCRWKSYWFILLWKTARSGKRMKIFLERSKADLPLLPYRQMLKAALDVLKDWETSHAYNSKLGNQYLSLNLDLWKNLRLADHCLFLNFWLWTWGKKHSKNIWPEFGIRWTIHRKQELEGFQGARLCPFSSMVSALANGICKLDWTGDRNG